MAKWLPDMWTVKWLPDMWSGFLTREVASWHVKWLPDTWSGFLTCDIFKLLIFLYMFLFNWHFCFPSICCLLFYPWVAQKLQFMHWILQIMVYKRGKITIRLGPPKSTLIRVDPGGIRRVRLRKVCRRPLRNTILSARTQVEKFDL